MGVDEIYDFLGGRIRSSLFCENILADVKFDMSRMGKWKFTVKLSN